MNYWVKKNKRKKALVGMPDIRSKAFSDIIDRSKVDDDYYKTHKMLVLAGVIDTNTPESMEIYNESLA